MRRMAKRKRGFFPPSLSWPFISLIRSLFCTTKFQLCRLWGVSKSVTYGLTSHRSLMSRSWARLLSSVPNPCWRRVWSPENWGNASFWSQDNKDTLLRGAAQLNSRLPRWNCNSLFSSWKRKLTLINSNLPLPILHIAKQTGVENKENYKQCMPYLFKYHS